MISTLGYIALLIGVILVIVGYTVEARALRPGWGCVILGVVLVVLGYLLPTLVTADYPDHAQSSVTQQLG